MFNSLRSRLTAAGVTLAILAVGITALVVANTTSADLISDIDARLDDQSFVLSELTTYAIVNGSWNGVGELTKSLSAEVGLRIAVTDLDGSVLADSDPDADQSGLLAAAFIDPSNPIFGGQLTAASADSARALAELMATCLDDEGIPFTIVEDELGFVQVFPEFASDEAFEAEARCFDDAVFELETGEELFGLFDDEIAEPAVLFLGAAQSPRVSWPIVLSVAAVVAAVLAAAAWWFSRRLSTPLISMTNAALQIRGGDLSVRVDAADSTEIDELAAAFNEMATELEDAANRRRRFTSDVAHELRTPLANITSHVEALIDGIETPSADTLRVVQAEVDHVATLVSDLQQLTLVDEGQLRLDPFDVVLADVIDQVVQGNQARALAAEVALNHVGEASDPITLDPIRIRQAIDNLVSNAIRHTPSGGVVIISVAQLPDETLVAIRDTGPGIPEDFLGYVFDRFSRADRSRSRRTGGSGLGLPIARELVRAHGGDITAENLAGAGAQLTIRLPRPAPRP
ncbi:MAG: sensor histidine kinase [Acidimicrobiia bacterium]